MGSTTSTKCWPGVDPGEVAAAYHRCGWASWSDAAIGTAALRTVAQPFASWVSSFVLHAPHEVLARWGLLGLVEPQARDAARQRLILTAAQYAAAGTPLAEPSAALPSGTTQGLGALAAAIGAGRVDEADAGATALARTLAPAAMVAQLAPLLLDRIPPHGHGPILLFLLARVAPRVPQAGLTLRCVVRAAAAEPGLRVRVPSAPAACHGDPELLARQLAGLQCTGPSPGTSMLPVLTHLADDPRAHAILAGSLPGLTVEAATPVVLRTAARSMLQDDPTHAPYGWTHALTVPQAVLGLTLGTGADPATALAVATNAVLGFRGAMGQRPLDLTWEPPAVPGGLEALAGSPAEAAGAAFHAAAAGVPALEARLATAAALHADAHLAKYTLACLDACGQDPAGAAWYRAAAAYLAAWWARKDRAAR